MRGEKGARSGTDEVGARFPDAGMRNTPVLLQIMALLTRR
jgi:hypothetical protein